MEKEKIDYIFNHYFHLLTLEEKVAWKHLSTNYKIENSELATEKQKEARIKVYYKCGWLSKDEKILKLVENGIDDFKTKTVERVLNDNEIELNLCPKCKKLARTPKAKQCRFCFFDWH